MNVENNKRPVRSCRLKQIEEKKQVEDAVEALSSMKAKEANKMGWLKGYQAVEIKVKSREIENAGYIDVENDFIDVEN